MGGGEPGYIAPDPKDLDVYFAGTNNDLGLPAVRWASLIAAPIIVIAFGLYMIPSTIGVA